VADIPVAVSRGIHCLPPTPLASPASRRTRQDVGQKCQERPGTALRQVHPKENLKADKK